MAKKFLTKIDATAGVTAPFFEVSETGVADIRKIVWNAIDGTFDMGLLNGVTLQSGQELHFYGKAVGAISNGQAVMFSGVEGDHLLMSLADAATINANPQYFIGVATQNFANNDFGYITVLGKVRGLDTSARTQGAVLYYDSSSATDGLLTHTVPTAPNAKIEVAAVVRVHATQGVLMVRPHIMPKISMLSDVHISSIVNNELLTWSTNRFENKSIATILGYTPANDSGVVHIAGAETITGVKTFSSVINASTLSINGGTLVGNNIVSMRSNPTGGQFRIEKSDGSLSAYPFYIGVDGTALAYYYNAAGALKVLLHTNDTSYFGNSLSVGYSTYAATSYMLDVNGTARFTSSVNVQNFLSVSSASTLVAPSSGKSIEMVYRTDGSNDYAFIQTYDRTNSVFKQLRITGSTLILNEGGGNVGFGLNNPQSQLHLNGTVTFSESGYDTVRLHTITHSHSDGSNVNNWLSFNVSNGSGVTNTVLRLNGAGQLRLNSYTSSTSYSGTAAGYLAFDSSGNVITVAGVAATDNTKLPFNGVSTRFNGDLNTLGLSGTTGVYNLGGTLTNSPSTYGTLYAIWNSDISTQFYVSYNGSAYWRQSVGATYAGSSWKTFLDSSNYNSYALALSGGTMTGALVVAAGDRGFEVNTSGGISFYSNEINAGALGGTGTIYLGWRRTTQVNVGVPMVLSSSISATSASLSGILSMSTSGTSYISMGRFPNSVTNGGEAWLGRASDRSTGTMTVQLGVNNSQYFEIVDYAWTTVTLKVGMNDFSYKGNAVIHAGNIGSYTSGSSQQVTINYNNDSNSTYQLLWGSGNSVYGTSQVYINPSSDVIYARGGYISPGNPWGTSDSAFFPNGITTAGGTNWIYGTTYLGNAPGNGAGHQFWADGTALSTSTYDIGKDSSSNTGVGIKYVSGGYGRIRFYQDGSNHSTIHSFGSAGYSPSSGKINLDGQNGVNIGAWNDPDFVVNKGAQTYARGYRGIGNVGGTGEASYHPAGIYSTGTNWLYGTMYMNNNSIRDVMEVYNNGWFRTVGNQGLYNPTNGAHFYPNDLSYGSWRILGSKNGWTGLHFGGGNGITLMMNEGEFGFHREGVGWVARFTSGRFYGTADYAVSAGSATDSSKLPLSGGTINGNLTVYGNYASSGELYTGYQFKCGSGSDTPYLNNPYGADHFRAAGTAWFTYTAIGSTNFFSTSRRAVKTMITNFDRSATDLINSVNVVEFRYKNDLNNKRIGFIAEDTIEELATKQHDQMDLNSSIGLLLKAVQELSADNNLLKQEISLLKQV